MKKLIALLLLAASQAFASVDLGVSASHTPYDQYMQPVKQVLGKLSGNDVGMDRVQALMKEGKDFRYAFTTPYVAATPAMTANLKAGDCKAKALWLCDQLGDSHVRFVVGKGHANSKLSHAWVMWEHEGKWWILDCTATSRPIAADSVSSDEYIPQYSWTKNGVYRHGLAQADTAAGIAGKRRAAVATDGKS